MRKLPPCLQRGNALGHLLLRAGHLFLRVAHLFLRVAHLFLRLRELILIGSHLLHRVPQGREFGRHGLKLLLDFSTYRRGS